RPSFGSYVSRMSRSPFTPALSPSGGEGEHPSVAMPKFVSLKGDDQEIAEAEQPLWVGPQHRAFVPNRQGLVSLEVTKQVDISRLRNRQELLKELDTLRRDVDTRGEMGALDVFSGQALDMITSGKARRAFDLSEEDPKT